MDYLNLIPWPAADVLLTTQTALIALLGLSIGYHMAQAFREIETYLGQPGFTAWFISAIKKSTHHYDIGLIGMIGAISIYLAADPFTRTNAATFIFTMFFAAFWDDRADAPPQALIKSAMNFLLRKK